MHAIHANFLQLGKITTHWDILPVPLYIVDSCKMTAAAFMLKKGSQLSARMPLMGEAA